MATNWPFSGRRETLQPLPLLVKWQSRAPGERRARLAFVETKAHIGRQIRRAREELGWTQGELSRRFGVSSATATRWEKGNQAIAFPDLERLAKLLEKPVQFFLPGWYRNRDAMAPNLVGLVGAIEAIPQPSIRDGLIEGFMLQIAAVQSALGAIKETKD